VHEEGSAQKKRIRRREELSLKTFRKSRGQSVKLSSDLKPVLRFQVELFLGVSE
jgi:hypothetical protein